MKKHTVKEIAEMINGRIIGSQDREISGVASLLDASENDISFLSNKKYAGQLATTKASAIMVAEDSEKNLPGGKTFIVCANPNATFTKVAMLFAPDPVTYPKEIHVSAVVSETAKISESASVGACAVIEDGAEIGDNTVIGAGTYIGHFTKIGSGTLIYPNVTVREHCTIGKRVIIHSGVVIGADGYGYEPGPTGIVKIPQVGSVRIDDDVEIGANSTIDRARFGKTWIKRGVKIDNLVHVAHNVTVGEFSMLIGQCGIAGSAVIGKGVIIAAQAGINGHITIGDGAKIAGTSGVLKDVPPGESLVGTPAENPRDFLERILLPQKVKKMVLKMLKLENSMAELRQECKKNNRTENL